MVDKFINSQASQEIQMLPVFVLDELYKVYIWQFFNQFEDIGIVDDSINITEEQVHRGFYVFQFVFRRIRLSILLQVSIFSPVKLAEFPRMNHLSIVNQLVH